MKINKLDLNEIMLINDNDFKAKKLYQYFIRNPFIHYKNQKNIIQQYDFEDDFIFDNIMDTLSHEMNKRKGLIYIVSNQQNPHYFKIGMTKKDMETRLKTLYTSGLFYQFEAKRAYPVKDVFLEFTIHQDLKNIIGKQTFRKNKEFFMIPLNVIEQVIQENIQQFDDFLQQSHIGKYFL